MKVALLGLLRAVAFLNAELVWDIFRRQNLSYSAHGKSEHYTKEELKESATLCKISILDSILHN
jgi:hypothetical protein